MISLLAITVTLTLNFGAPASATWSLDVTPVVLVRADPARIIPGVLASSPIPRVVIIRPQGFTDPGYYSSTVSHELVHQRQMDALGPWFYVAYAATLGRPFEPRGNLPQATDPMDLYEPDLGTMWQPSQRLAARCPMLRIGSAGTAFEPCWRF